MGVPFLREEPDQESQDTSLDSSDGSPHHSTTQPVTGPAKKLQTGQLFGRFRILYPLGAGGMGEVYAALDTELARKVAIKVLLLDTSLDEVAKQLAAAQLLSEAKALARLKHESVVPIYDVGNIDGIIYLSMEMLEGTTLNEWTTSGKRTIDNILRVMIDAAKGISAAHQAGLVHRDIKPHNIMVCHDGRVYVLDFGLAEIRSNNIESSTRRNHRKQSDAKPLAARQDSESTFGTQFAGGTPSYMSPEQYAHLAVDPRTDVWSFGVTLFEVLANKRPFRGSNIGELATRIATAQKSDNAWPNQIPRSLHSIIDRCLCLQPTDRYPNFDSLIYELQRVRHAYRLRWTRRLGIFCASALLGVAISISASASEQSLRCSTSTERQIENWTRPRKDALLQRIVSRHVDIAAPMQRRAIKNLAFDFVYAIDRWIQTWKDFANNRCLDAVHDPERAAVYARQITCQQDQLSAITSLLRATEQSKSLASEHLENAIESLPNINACDDLVQLKNNARPPPPADEKDRFEALEARVERIVSLSILGQSRAAVDECDAAIQTSEQISFPYARARVALVCSQLIADDARPAQAAELAQSGLYAAISIDWSEAASELAASLTFLYGYRLAASDEFIDDYIPLAHALIQRQRDQKKNTSNSRFGFYGYAAVAHAMRGRTNVAERLFHRALATNMEHFGPFHDNTIGAYNNLSIFLLTERESAQRAKSVALKGLHASRIGVGEDHPGEARLRGNLLRIARLVGDDQLGTTLLKNDFFEKNRSYLSIVAWGYAWLEQVSLALHRRDFARASTLIEQHEQWRLEQTPDDQINHQLVITFRAQLAIADHQYALGEHHLAPFLKQYLTLGKTPTQEFQAHPVVLAAFIASCRGDRQKTEYYYRPMNANLLMNIRREREAGWEYRAIHASTELYLGKHEDASQALEQYTAAHQPIFDNGEIAFGWVRAAADWAMIAQALGQIDRANAFLRDAEQTLANKLPPGDPIRVWLEKRRAVFDARLDPSSDAHQSARHLHTSPLCDLP